MRHKIKNAIYHYRKKEFLMTEAEHDFFHVLVELVGPNYYVFPQVHISSILDHRYKGQGWTGALGHINSKSVDFVICTKQAIRPRVAIELDDWSHQLTKRQQRDTEVERILEEANLPLLRFSDWRSLSTDEISAKIQSALHATHESKTPDIART